MGCFKQTSFLSNLQLSDGTPSVLIFMKTKGRGHATYATDNYEPILMPIFGTYDDYGRIENIERDKNVEFIEEFFGTDIDNLVKIIDDRMIGRYTKEENPFGAIKNAEYLKDVVFALEHREIYDLMVSLGNEFSWFENADITEWFLTDLLGLESINDKYQGFEYTYRIPNNKETVILSNGSRAEFYNINKNEFFKDFKVLGEDVWGIYHPKEFMMALALFTGSDDFYSKIKDYEHVSLSEHKHNIYLLKNAKVDIPEITEFKYQAILKTLKDDPTKKLTDILSDNEYEDFIEWKYRKLGIFSSLNETYKHEYLGGIYKETHSGGINLLKIYGEDAIMSKDLRKNIIDTMNFHTMVSTNSMTYKLSSYGDQCSNYEFYKSFYGKCLQITENEIQREDEW